jgi:molybdate transport system substrate-binding protein
MKIPGSLLAAVLLSVSAPVFAAGTVTVAVAANVKFAFQDLAATFTKETGIAVKDVVSSSGKITAQVLNGAPFDVFLSADTGYPEKLRQQGQTASPAKIYAYGTLVLWTMKDLDLSRGVAALTDDAITKVAIANPRLAPYGRESIRAMAHYHVYTEVKPKLVYGQSISQTSQYIDSAAVDVGFTSKSVVLAPDVKGRGHWVEVPHDAYQPIAQAAVILKHGRDSNAEAARKFFDFIYSPPARDIFSRFGYVLP